MREKCRVAASIIIDDFNGPNLLCDGPTLGDWLQKTFAINSAKMSQAIQLAAQIHTNRDQRDFSTKGRLARFLESNVVPLTT